MRRKKMLFQLLTMMASLVVSFFIYSKTNIPMHQRFPLLFVLILTLMSFKLLYRYHHLPRVVGGEELSLDTILYGILTGWIAILIYIDIMVVMIFA